jgi:hypothetical protein
LLKIVDKNKINLFTDNIETEDVTISKKISETFSIKHTVLNNKNKNIIKEINNKLLQIKKTKKILT